MSFFKNSKAANITIGHNVTYVNGNMANAFYNCFNMNSPIRIPNGVTNMYYAFYNCRNFNQPVEIPNGVSHMGYAFAGCKSLNQYIDIPKGVVNLYGVFRECESLAKDVYIPASVVDIRYAFTNTNYGGNLYFIGANNAVEMNFYGIFNNRASGSKRVNIYANNLGWLQPRLIDPTGQNTLILGVNLKWTTSGQWRFNALYNIYVYTAYRG